MIIILKVNNKVSSFAIDLNSPLHINWSQFQYPQKAYQLKILDESESSILHQEEEKTARPFTSIFLSEYNQKNRKKLIIELTINDGTPSAITEKAYFYTMNHQLNEAEWITRKDNPIEKDTEYYKDKPNIILEKSFEVDSMEADIFLDISGLGYYIVKINDENISDSYLNSDVTNYNEMVYYDTYRINEFTKNGTNTIQVELANGWYNPAPIKMLGKYNVRKQMSIGKPSLIAQVTSLRDGVQEVLTNTGRDWKGKAGQYLFDNIFIGEKYTFRDYEINEFERTVDLQTVTVPGPTGQLVPSFIPKIKRTRKHLPTSIKETKKGLLVTFNEIISGQLGLSITANSKQELILKYGESINGDEIDYTSSSPGTKNDIYGNYEEMVVQQDELLLKEGVNHYENTYTYHSFRYVLIECGDFNEIQIDNIHAYSVHTDMALASSFESSNNWVNKLFEVGVQTKLNNIHSYYEDCPRERLGYGGDIVALIESQVHSFESREMLEKVLNDFENDQNQDGGITQTAPYMGIQTHGPSDRAGSLGWQYVVPVILNTLIKYYGDIEHYVDKLPAIKKHLDYLMSFDFDYIKICCLGDWGSIDNKIINNKETPPDKAFSSAVFYLLILKEYYTLLQKYSNVTEVNYDINLLLNKIKEVETDIVEEFYHESGYFGEGSQSSFAFALKANLPVDKEPIYENFKRRIVEDEYILRSGIFGMSWTYELLDGNDNNIVFQWLKRKTHPSLYKALENGNNIMPEYFIEDSDKYLNISKNHAMFTSYGAWFIKKILGIQWEKINDGHHLQFSPYFPQGMDYAKGSQLTPSGEIKVYWEKNEKEIDVELTIPNSINLEISGGQPSIKQEASDGFETTYHLTYTHEEDYAKR